MAEIVNLRKFRKNKEKAEREAKALQNNLLHGQTKAERRRTEAIKEQAAKSLDNHKLEGKLPE